MADEKYIAERVTQLRERKGVSEHKMSLDMGHSGSYIRSISSGKALPSMSEFLYMCEYLGVTPEEFFREDMKAPAAVQSLYRLAVDLNEEQLSALISVARLFSEEK